MRAGAGALASRSALALLMVGVAVAAAGPIAGRFDVETPATGGARADPDVRRRRGPWPADDFRNYTEQPAGQVSNVHDDDLVTVRGLPDGARVRFAALDVWDQTASPRTTAPCPGARTTGSCGSRAASPTPRAVEEVVVDARIHPNYDSPWVPIAGALQWFDFEGNDGRRRMRASGSTPRPRPR